ncbi:MAG: hypothetical protein U0414_21950 [Polyangiaceae bacterium]
MANPWIRAPVVLSSRSGITFVGAVHAVFVVVAFQSPHVTPPISRSAPLSVTSSDRIAPPAHAKIGRLSGLFAKASSSDPYGADCVPAPPPFPASTKIPQLAAIEASAPSIFGSHSVVTAEVLLLVDIDAPVVVLDPDPLVVVPPPAPVGQ